MPRLLFGALLCVLLAAGARAAIHTVNSAADTDDSTCDAANCTLREAIDAANAASGGTIEFAIGSGPATITLASALPVLATPILLDATTQPGYAGTPLIQLNGHSASANCLVLRAGDSLIRGLDIGTCYDAISVISDAGGAISNVAIERNFIGARMASAPINHYGIALNATGTSTLSNVTIGDGTAAGRNVVATFGFVMEALFIAGNTSDVTVAGNYFSIDESGNGLVTAARFTTDIGIYGSAGSNNILIGGPTPGARNVFGSGGGTQVNFKIDSQGSNLTIEGNYIGTDPTGTIRRAATNFGVWFFGQGAGTIRNNVITTSGGNAISRGVTTTGPVVVQGNWINIKADGSGAFPFVPSSAIGDFSSAPGYTIGGPNPGDGNVIANYSTGVFVVSPGARVQGNLIGLDPTGTNVLGSGARGIVTSFARTEPGVFFVGNRIAGFTTGIEVGNEALATVEGNYVGTDATGTIARPNTNGIVVTGAAGRAVIADNVIAGNSGRGVAISTTTMPVTLTGNRIGVDAAGGALPNGGDGIVVTSGTALRRIGTLIDHPNTIAHNGGNGISITGGNSILITGNSIFDNAGLAIDLGTAGIEPPDAGDADSGANGLQNAPVLTSASNDAAATTIQGSLHSSVSTTFTIELFANAVGDPSTYGEAQTFLTRFDVLTDGVGNALISTAVPLQTPGTVISATATNTTTSETSELSNDVLVFAGGTFAFSAATQNAGEADGIATITVTRNGGTVPASVQYSSTNGTALAGSDYTAVAGTLSFGAAETSKTFDVPIAADALDETNETVLLALSGFSGGAAGAPIAMTLTIGDDDAQPALGISNASVAEGDSGTTTMTFDVSLSAPSGLPVTVDYTTADTTATGGSDYGTRFGTLTFAAGETTKSVAITVNGDAVAEANETMQLLLSSSVNATIADATGIGTITNDDGDPAIAIADATIIEGNGGASSATLAVTLSNPSSSTVTVDWITTANTASSGSDYTTASGTVTFGPGDVTETIAVPILGDTIVEGNESFSVDLTNAANASIADPQAVLVIVDDDGSPALTISDLAVNESAGTATLTVLLAPASAQTVTVDFATVSVTALPADDYPQTTGTLTFDPGETSATISVPIVNDGVTEASETLEVLLSAPSNASTADGNATVTIIDDDPTPAITAGDRTVIEGAAASFEVTLSNPSAATITVAYATSNGTATGADFTAASNTLTFSPGQTAKTVNVLTTADTLQEPDETFSFQLAGATNATIARPQAMATIADDDGTPALLIGDASLLESDAGTTMASFVVTLAGNAAQTVTVDYAAANGTAVAGSDYASASGHLLFTPGTSTQTIEVPVVGDTDVEPDETFFVNLSNAANATISDNQALGTIANDDAAPAVPAISIGDASVVEGQGGTATLTFPVTLSAASTATVTVDYATADGSASAGSDYGTTSGTLVFAPGVTSRTIAVAVAGDTSIEGNETFSVHLSSPGNGTVGDGQGLGTIVNDDSAPSTPSIAIDNVSVDEGDSGARSAFFQVTLSSASPVTVSVDYATANGSATSGSDYAKVDGTLVFAPGVVAQAIAVAIAGDTLVEPDETFTVALTNPVHATIADAKGRGTIRNDDENAIPAISIEGTEVTEGDAMATFIVTLSAPASQPVFVAYATSDASAVAGADYQPANGTLAFAPGETSREITVPIVDDTILEGDESFALALSNATNATQATSAATAVIHDDDGGVAAVLVIGGSGAGNFGSFFRTVLQMHNPGGAAISGNLIVRPMGGGAPRTFGYALEPHETRDLATAIDVGGFVTVDLVPLAGVVPRTSVRVFNDGGEGGRSGFTASLVPVAQALTAGRRGILIAPDDASTTRFNLGMRALGAGARLTFTLRRANGTVAGEATRELGADVLVQVPASMLFGAPLENNDTIEILATQGAAIVYGSSVDNVTQDPSFAVAEPLP